MLPSNENNVRKSLFEMAMRLDNEGNEFWSARDLLQILEYANYSKFKHVLLKAQMACENSGQDVDAHFFPAKK